MEDITEQRASAARIFHLAHHDTLTDLPNRTMFQQHLETAVADAVTAHGPCVTLMLCDLDHFKTVNDTHGHPVGDELLRLVAKRMRNAIRKTDILARLGGDEFAIIHLSDGDPEGALGLAERVIASVREPYEILGNQVCVGMSVGIASAPGNAQYPVDLMKRADSGAAVRKQSSALCPPSTSGWDRPLTTVTRSRTSLSTSRYGVGV